MADQNVNVKFGGDASEAKKAASEVGSSLSSLTSTVKKFAVAAGAAFVAKEVVDFGISAVKAFADSEAAMARVGAVLKTLPKSVDVNIQQIEKLGQAAVKLGFDDEQAAENIAYFLQRTNDLTKAQELNALAMDLSRAKNIELGQAANLVGQVMSGNGRVLKQFGIEIDDTLGPMAALGELQTKVAGQSAAFADTTAGKLEILSISWENLKETVGAALAEGVGPFIDKLTAFVQDPQFVNAIVALAQAFTTILIPALDFVSKAILGAQMFVNDFKSGLDAVGEVIDSLVSKFNRMKSNMSEGMKAVKSIVTTGTLTGRASGGPVSGGSTYLVGERGPELFRPSSSGYITPNSRLAGGGGIVINITGNTLLDGFAGEKLANQIMQRLKGNLRM